MNLNKNIFKILEKLGFQYDSDSISLMKDGYVHYVYKVLTERGVIFVKIRDNHFSSNRNIKINPRDIKFEYAAYKFINSLPNLPYFLPRVLGFYSEYNALCVADIAKNNKKVSFVICDLDFDDIFIIGKTISVLHAYFKNKVFNIRGRHENDFYKNNLYYRLGFLSIKEIDSLISKLFKLPKQVIYGDFNPKNMVMSNSGYLSIFDLETVHDGNAVFDKSFFLSHFILDHYHNVNNLSKAVESFCAGYDSIGFLDLESQRLEVALTCSLVLYRLHSDFSYKTRLVVDKDFLSEKMLRLLQRNVVQWNDVYDILA